VTYAKLNDDRAFAKSNMPKARELTIGGVTGFTYEFTCEFGTKYVMFAWFNGSRYKVKLVSPEVERSVVTGFDAHDKHLYPDGTICLEDSMQGCASLSDAYSRSVLWANGHSIYCQTGEFPFSINNL